MLFLAVVFYLFVPFILFQCSKKKSDNKKTVRSSSQKKGGKSNLGKTPKGEPIKKATDGGEVVKSTAKPTIKNMPKELVKTNETVVSTASKASKETKGTKEKTVEQKSKLPPIVAAKSKVVRPPHPSVYPSVYQDTQTSEDRTRKTTIEKSKKVASKMAQSKIKNAAKVKAPGSKKRKSGENVIQKAIRDGVLAPQDDNNTIEEFKSCWGEMQENPCKASKTTVGGATLEVASTVEV